MSGPYQRRDLSNCGAGRLHIKNNCGVLTVKLNVIFYQFFCYYVYFSIGSDRVFFKTSQPYKYV